MALRVFRVTAGEISRVCVNTTGRLRCGCSILRGPLCLGGQKKTLPLSKVSPGRDASSAWAYCVYSLTIHILAMGKVGNLG